MPNRKTAVSIEQPIFERADELAQQMGVSRSRLYELALEMFIQKQENQQILERLNRFYDENPPTEEEEHLLAATRRVQRSLLEGEW